VNFDGTAAITVTAAAGTLSGATLASGVTASSLTSVGALTSLTTLGNITVGGDLTVNGTTTTVNSTTLAVTDLNITVAKDATSAATANGAGLTVVGPTTPATFTYSSADDRWNLNKALNVGTVYGALVGNASTVTTNANLTGDVSSVGNETTLATVATAGTYTTVTVNAKGLVTAGTTVTTVAQGGTALTALGTANQLLGVNTDATAFEYKTIAAGSGITVTPTAGVLTIAASSSSSDGITKAFYTGAVAAISGTTSIQADDTVPSSSEGTRLWTSAAITPESSASKFKIDYGTMVDSDTNGRTITFALFRGSTCIHAVNIYISSSGATKNLIVGFVDSPATTSSVTYSIRVGIDGGSSGSSRWYASQGSSVNYGGKSNTTWSITEY